MNPNSKISFPFYTQISVNTTPVCTAVVIQLTKEGATTMYSFFFLYSVGALIRYHINSATLLLYHHICVNLSPLADYLIKVRVRE